MAADLDWSRDEPMATPSRASSQTTFTESPPPSVSTWQSARHSRFPSSNSSISSSPTLRNSQDSFVPNRKVLLQGLPEIDEDTQQEPLRSPASSSSNRPSYEWTHTASKPRPTSFFHSFQVPAQRDGFLSDHEGHWKHEGHWNKRRKSSDSAWNSFTAGVVERFPSISKRTRQRKRASMSVVDTRSELHAPVPITPSFLRRSGSQRRSFDRISQTREMAPLQFEEDTEIQVDEEEEVEEHENDDNHQHNSTAGPAMAPGQVESIMQAFAGDALIPQLDGHGHPNDIETEPRSTTPILPPLMSKAYAPPAIDADLGSPLQSPTVATQSAPQSESHTPDGTPQHSAIASPTLSTRPSVASIHRSHYSNAFGIWNEIPPLVMADPTDVWAEKLGHANFSISPRPYVPEHCDEASCRKLVQDWEKARDEYAKHRSRTETHFGSSSRTFKLTEEKWSHIDAQWRINNDVAISKAIEAGAMRHPSPTEPAPVAKMPHLDDPRLLQSEDIPGPMKIEEPINPTTTNIKRTKSKRKQFLKLFSGFQFPSKALKSSSGTSAGVANDA